MANPNEWGPLFWKIIHTTSVSVGKQQLLILQQDEINALKSFIKQIPLLLPCKTCTKHYIDYEKTHKIDYNYTNLSSSMSSYFWNLHSEINSINGKTSIPLSDLPNIYNKRNITSLIKEFDVLFKKYILQRTVKPDVYRSFLKSLNRLYATIGI